MKVVKRVIVGVLVVALAAGGIYTGLVHVKKNKVTEVPVTSVSNLLTDWYSETTLDGTITTNVSQNINMDKDMIIEKIYVSQGDDVKKGDNLISFDMTLVEMELNIAKLKLQKQEQDLTKAQNRLTSLQNGGPIEDSTDSTDELDTSTGDTGSTGDDEMSSTDPSSSGNGDGDMQSTTGSAAENRSGSYLAAATQPLLLSAFTDVEFDSTEDISGQMEDVQGEEVPSAGSADQESESTESGSDGLGDGLIMEPSYQDPEVDDITDGENPTENPDEPAISATPTPTPTLGPDELPDPNGNGTEQEIPGITDGEPEFYQKLDDTSQPFTGTGTEEDPYVFLVSSAKGKVTVMGSFFNRMAGYSADGTKVVQEGGSWFQLEFHENDTIADFQDRTLSCTGYYLIDGNMLSNPVDRFAEMDFTLDGAMQYDNGDDEPDIPGDGGGGGGSSSLSRSEAIKIQKNRIASLELDVQESEISISKLQKKADRKLITSKLDGIVTTVGDAATGTNSESDSFMIVKSKDGYYVQGTVGELMLDQVKEGTILNCNSYGENGYMNFEAEVIQVSDYAVDGDSSYYYYGDSNPNVSSYNFTAKITDDTVQVSVGDWVDIQLEQQAQSTDGIVLSKAFVRTEDGVSYVYKDDNGVLKKQIVKVKENVNGGAYVLVSGGLSMDDKIAFPYSKSIKEGMKTKEGSLDTFMGYDSTSYGGLG